jgi:hypothetical protein
MAITATLVEQGNNRVRYLLVCDTTGTTTLNITTTGAATPDLATDSLAGPVKACAKAGANGLGAIPAGALTQAQARAIWLADNANANQGTQQPRCRARHLNQSGAADWLFDANVTGGAAIVVVTANNVGQTFLDIESSGSIGV